MHPNRQHAVIAMENMIFAAFGDSDAFPLQIADDDEIMIELMQDVTLLPHDRVEAELHHQIDPSYED